MQWWRVPLIISQIFIAITKHHNQENLWKALESMGALLIQTSTQCHCLQMSTRSLVSPPGFSEYPQVRSYADYLTLLNSEYHKKKM